MSFESNILSAEEVDFDSIEEVLMLMPDDVQIVKTTPSKNLILAECFDTTISIDIVPHKGVTFRTMCQPGVSNEHFEDFLRFINFLNQESPIIKYTAEKSPNGKVDIIAHHTILCEYSFSILDFFFQLKYFSAQATLNVKDAFEKW